MCQKYEGERSYMVGAELREIKEKWRKHESGEAPLTDEEITQLAVRKLILRER